MVSNLANRTVLRHPISGKPHPVIASAAKQSNALHHKKTWIASSLTLLAMTELTQHRQLDHIIGVANAALENGVHQFKVEAARRANAALGRKSAAEHGAAVRQPSASETTINEFFHRKQVIERAFLVQLARAADQGVRTQDHLVPVTGNVFEFPQHRRDRLVAHLL